MEQLSFKELKETVYGRLNTLEVVDDDIVMDLIEQVIYQDMLFAPMDKKEGLIRDLFNEFRRLGRLQPLLDDDEITEIMINGWDHVFIEKGGKIVELEEGFDSGEELYGIVQKIVAKMDRKVNEKHPICDVRLEDGSRVNIVLNPISIGGVCVTIRKFPKRKLDRTDLINNHTVSEEAMDFLEMLVGKRLNMFISGGTSSGKTTLLNVLSNAVDSSERLITIEDSAELQISACKNLVRLEARNTKDEFNNQVSIRDLIKTALRMRPDRIVVGEVRGEEAIDMLQSLNTGHDGSISTGHSNTVYDMLFRLETMVLSGMNIPLMAIRQQIASAIEIMIHVQKIKGKGRRIIDISEVIGIENEHIVLQPLFTYDEGLDVLVKTKNEMIHKEKLAWN